MAATREDSCGVEGWMFDGLSVHDSLGILLSVFPGNYKRLVDCDLAAHNCEEVQACEKYYFLDHVEYEDMGLPECGLERTDHCEGNVVKFCEGDSGKTLYEASYDCALAGATCVEWQSESGERWADCQAPQLQCQGPDTRYCDGTRVVTCEESLPGYLSPWAYDCAGVFGSHCTAPPESRTECEGPEVGETNCYDGIDGDGDGKVDCMDLDCGCVEKECDDGIDRDGDGKVDCDDEDCLGDPKCP